MLSSFCTRALSQFQSAILRHDALPAPPLHLAYTPIQRNRFELCGFGGYSHPQLCASVTSWPLIKLLFYVLTLLQFYVFAHSAIGGSVSSRLRASMPLFLNDAILQPFSNCVPDPTLNQINVSEISCIHLIFMHMSQLTTFRVHTFALAFAKPQICVRVTILFHEYTVPHPFS